MIHLVILVYFLNLSLAQFPSYSKVSKTGSNIEGVQIPLCQYVEVEEGLDDAGELFVDPEHGCISCKLELQQQCTKEPRVQCRLEPRPVEVCNGCQRQQPLAENTLWRAQVDSRHLGDGCVEPTIQPTTTFQTICKKYTPTNCDDSSEDCSTQELCYQKPVTTTGVDERTRLCRVKRSRLRKTLRVRVPIRAQNVNCIPNCETKLQSERVCSTEQQESCQAIEVRVCEPKPAELCLGQSKLRYRLECKGFTELKEITNKFVTN